MKLAVMDIGGSSIKYAQMDESLSMQFKGVKETPPKSKSSFLEALDQIWLEIGQDTSGLSISMPGRIDPIKGYAYTGGALAYLNDCYLADELAERYQIPVLIGNDAKCAAAAELEYGALKGIKDAFVIILGTGIGGCVILDRKVRNGQNFSSGEFSNIYVQPDDLRNPNTSWVGVNGIHGLLRNVQEVLKTKEKFTGIEIFAMANQGNQLVLSAIQLFAKNLAVQIYNLQSILDVEKVLIGGGISDQPLLKKMICEEVHEIFSINPYTPAVEPVIDICQHRNDANLLGAYYQFVTMAKVEKQNQK